MLCGVFFCFEVYLVVETIISLSIHLFDQYILIVTQAVKMQGKAFFSSSTSFHDDQCLASFINQSTNSESIEEILQQIQIEETERKHLLLVKNQIKTDACSQLSQLYFNQITTLNNQNQALRQQIMYSNRKNNRVQSFESNRKNDLSITRREAAKKQDKQNQINQSIKAKTPKKQKKDQSNINRSVCNYSFHSNQQQNQQKYSYSLSNTKQFKKNIFSQLINEILDSEQKRVTYFTNSIYSIAQKEMIHKDYFCEKNVQFNQIEKEIIFKQNNFQDLQNVLKEYQQLIKKADCDFDQLDEATKQLLKNKRIYIQMELKCSQQHIIQTKIVQKKQELTQYKQSKNEGKKRINSVQMLLRMFGFKMTEQNNRMNQQYVLGLRSVRQSGKYTMMRNEDNKFYIKEIKAVMHNLKEERKKHAELVELYLRRIQKISKKIKRYESDRQF